jgi:hypothetical protein
MSAITLPGNVARMPALSIRQPWAWLIVNGFKDIENRDWPTKFRGPLLIHAGKKLTVPDYDAAMLFIEAYVDPALVGKVPDIGDLLLGGVTGMVTLTDCVAHHTSPWFTGGFSPAVTSDGSADENTSGSSVMGYGFVLADAKPLHFIPYRGRLGFFDVVVRP